MLSKRMVTALNGQVNAELYASNLYLQMSAWCGEKGLDGCAAFLRKQADEEMQHMRKLLDYVIGTGALAEVGAVQAPTKSFRSVKDVFSRTYDHECAVTKKIYELVETAQKEKDHSTVQFLQWYVAEQHEEEKLFKSILDTIEIIGTDGRGIFFIDREIGRLAAGTAPSAASR